MAFDSRSSISHDVTSTVFGSKLWCILLYYVQLPISNFLLPVVQTKMAGLDNRSFVDEDDNNDDDISCGSTGAVTVPFSNVGPEQRRTEERVSVTVRWYSTAHCERNETRRNAQTEACKRDLNLSTPFPILAFEVSIEKFIICSSLRCYFFVFRIARPLWWKPICH